MSAGRRMLNLAARVIALALVAGMWDARPVAAQTEVVEYYGQDALGSIRIVFNASGAAIARADYEPFGETFTVPGMPGTSGLPATQFTGQERDAEASLDYFGARFFVPRTGRFSQVDPVFAGLFEPQQWNRYAYVRNNPLMFVDPDGRNAAAFFGSGNPNFCSAAHSLQQCGGMDAFWSDWGGGGGGFSFGDGHAWALSVGWTPNMPDDMAGALMDFVQQSEQALLTAQLEQQMSDAYAYLTLDGNTQTEMQAIAYGEMSGATQDQFAAILSTMINRAFLTGAPMGLILNQGDYQALVPQKDYLVGNVPYNAFKQGASSPALAAAFARIVQYGVSTNATSFKTGDATRTGLGNVLPATPDPSLKGPAGTLYLWVVAPGAKIIVPGWRR